MSDLRPAHVTHGMSVVAGCEKPQVGGTVGGSQLNTSEAHPVRQHHVGGPLTPELPEAALNRILPDAQDSSPTARPAETRGEALTRSDEVADLHHSVRLLITEYQDVHPSFACTAPEAAQCRQDGECQAILTFEPEGSFECYEAEEGQTSVDLRSGPIVVWYDQTWNWRYPTAVAVNPLQEVAGLAARVKALADETAALQERAQRLARVCDLQRAEINRLKDEAVARG